MVSIRGECGHTHWEILKSVPQIMDYNIPKQIWRLLLKSEKSVFLISNQKKLLRNPMRLSKLENRSVLYRARPNDSY